ncbi:unnamed protein product, partial [Mesorhabditis spiculigera]
MPAAEGLHVTATRDGVQRHIVLIYIWPGQPEKTVRAYLGDVCREFDGPNTIITGDFIIQKAAVEDTIRMSRMNCVFPPGMDTNYHSKGNTDIDYLICSPDILVKKRDAVQPPYNPGRKHFHKMLCAELEFANPNGYSPGVRLETADRIAIPYFY